MYSLCPLLRKAAFGLVCLSPLQGLLGATFTVTNNNDSGAGSLRQAITNANASADASSTINVNASYAITLASTLPTLSKNITLAQSPFTISGSLDVNLGSIALTFNQNNTVTFAGNIKGAGSVVQAGSKTLTLTGTSTYTGGMTFNGGVVIITEDANLGNKTGTLTFGGGELDINFDDYSTARTVTINAGGATLNILGNQTTLSGTITSSGPLSKIGDGTLILTGTNTFTGTTTISAGTLQANTASIQGDIVNNLTVIFNQSATGTYAQNMSGSGQLLKQNSGTLIMTGSNSYSGGTTVSGGTLQGDSDALQGAIVNNGAVIFDQAAAGTYSGVLSGTGSVTKTGAATLTMSGANIYTGGTTVSAGALQGTTSSLQGAILNNASVIFNQSADGTYAGAMSGTGTLTKLGTGTVTLSGANSYSGGTTVSAGTLQGTTLSLQGAITDNAALIFNQGFDGTYAGALSGTGTLEKAGVGKVTTTSALSVSSTTISGGTLLINGTLTSPTVTVSTQGALGGTGTITGTVTNNGTVTPGDGLGTLSIVGSYVHASTADLNTSITPTASALLTMTGTMTLSGGTVSVNPLNMEERFLSSAIYTVAHANGGIAGTFDSLSVISPLPLFSGTVSVLANDVQILVVVSPFSSVVKGGNPGAVASYLDTFSSDFSNSDFNLVISQLQLLPQEDLIDALNQLQPAQYTALALSQESNAALVASAIQERVEELYKTECTRCQERCLPWSVWGAPYADLLTFRGEKRFVGFDAKSLAAVVGADYAWRPKLLFGALGGYSHTRLDWNQSAGKDDTDSFYGGLYATWFPKRFFLSGSLLGGWSRFDAERHVTFNRIDRHPHTEHTGFQALAHLDGGGIVCRKQLEIRPFAALDALWLKNEGFSESGGKSIDLKVSETTYSMLRSELGVKVANCWCVNEQLSIIPDFKLSWIYEARFDGGDFTAHFKEMGGSFSAKGQYPNKGYVATGFGLTGLIAEDRASLSLRYDGAFGSGIKDNRLRLNFIYSF